MIIVIVITFSYPCKFLSLFFSLLRVSAVYEIEGPYGSKNGGTEFDQAYFKICEGIRFWNNNNEVNRIQFKYQDVGWASR